MYRIRRLQPSEVFLLNQIDMGYESDCGYKITRSEQDMGWAFSLTWVRLDPPFSREYDWDWSLEEETIANAKNGLVFAAEVEGQTIGMIEGSQVSASDLEIKSLFVSRPYRKKGIGRQLVEALTQVGKASGAKRLIVTTQATDGQAVKFYLAQGFELIGLNCNPDSAQDWEHGEAILFFHRNL